MCDVAVVPVAQRDWAVIADGRLLCTAPSRDDARRVAQALAAQQQVANLYGEIFALQDVIEDLQSRLETR